MKKSEANSLHLKIISHPFVIANMTNYASLLEMITSRISKTEARIDLHEQAQEVLENVRKTDEKKYNEFCYHGNVNHYVNNLISGVERLHMIPIFLKRFPRNKTYDLNGITLHRWIQYHYSNYVVTSTSIYDTALLVVNEVFALGLEPRNCTNTTVRKNEYVKKSKVGKALEEFDNAISQFWEPRHHFVHRNIIPNLNRLDELERLRFIDELDQKYAIPNDPIMQPVVGKWLYQHNRKTLIEDVVRDSNKIAVNVGNLLDRLGPVYSGFTNVLKKR